MTAKRKRERENAGAWRDKREPTALGLQRRSRVGNGNLLFNEVLDVWISPIFSRAYVQDPVGLRTHGGRQNVTDAH